MMDFVMMTLSFTVAILLASGISVMVCTNKTVLKWYAKKAMKISAEIAEETLGELMDSEEN